MRISDYVGQASYNLWKKKLRTILTTSGVVIGVGALVSMFAFGQGVQRNITDRVKKLDLFNYIDVFPRGGPERRLDGPHDPDEDRAGRQAERRKRRGMPIQGPNETATGPRLDAQMLERIKALPSVEAAFPELRFPAQIGLGGKEEFTLVQVLPVDVCRSGLVKLRAGTCYAADANELVISDVAPAPARGQRTGKGAGAEDPSRHADAESQLHRSVADVRRLGPAGSAVRTRELLVHGRRRHRPDGFRRAAADPERRADPACRRGAGCGNCRLPAFGTCSHPSAE